METFFLTINEWMTGAAALAALGCFLWGVVSVLFSPCHLASIPLMVAYVAGQQKAVNPKQAVGYSAAFTIGLFVTIALIGVICALLGRMLGDVGNYWQILVGAVLIWVALGMLGVESCTLSSSLLGRFNMKGLPGAFALGLSYGTLSGSCTFGFIAPILAIGLIGIRSARVATVISAGILTEGRQVLSLPGMAGVFGTVTPPRGFESFPLPLDRPQGPSYVSRPCARATARKVRPPLGARSFSVPGRVLHRDPRSAARCAFPETSDRRAEFP